MINNKNKIYVNMIVEMNKYGEILPRKILWNDGRIFDIDKIIDKRKSASLKAGGCGIRYTCIISGQQRYIFLDNGKWFIEHI